MSLVLMVFFVLTAYLLGSIPFGLIVARKVKGIDIREHGSRNTGATNVFRVVGRKWGFLVLFLDALKGASAVLLPGMITGSPVPFEYRVAFAVCAILGHSFSVWMSWKGGKGVATSLGVFLALAPLPTLVTLAGWILVFAVTRIISAASLAAAVFFPAAVAFFFQGKAEWGLLFPLALLLTAFIFYTHRANIGRLLRGEEKRLF